MDSAQATIRSIVRGAIFPKTILLHRMICLIPSDSSYGLVSTILVNPRRTTSIGRAEAAILESAISLGCPKTDITFIAAFGTHRTTPSIFCRTGTGQIVKERRPQSTAILIIRRQNCLSTEKVRDASQRIRTTRWTDIVFVGMT